MPENINAVRARLAAMDASGEPGDAMWKAVTDSGYTKESYAAALSAARQASPEPATKPATGGTGMSALRGLNNAAGTITSGILGPDLASKAAGGLDALWNKIQGRPGNYGPEQAAEMRQIQATQAAHPYLAGAGNVAGMVAATAAPISKLLGPALEAGQPIMNTLRGATAAGAVGGAYGAANSGAGSVAGVAKDFNKGAAAGGAAGLVAAPLMAGGNAALGAAADSLEGPLARLRQYATSKLGTGPAAAGPMDGSVPPLQAAPGPPVAPVQGQPAAPVPAPQPSQPQRPPASPGAVSAVLSQLENDGTSVGALRSRLQQSAGVGKPLSIAEAANPGGNVQGRARAMFTATGPSRAIAKGASDQSVAGAPQRVRSDINTMAGEPGADTQALQASVEGQRAAAAGPAYERAMAQGDLHDPALASMLEDNPSYADAHGRAIAQNNQTASRGSAISPLFGEDGKLVRAPNVQDVDMIKKGIDSRIYGASGPVMDTAKADAKMSLSNLSNARTNLMNVVDPLAPDYASARGQFGDSTEVANALEAGRDLIMSGRSASPFEVRSTMAQLSDAGKKAYRAGVQDALSRQVGADADLSRFADVTRGVIGSEQGTKLQMLKEVFGDGPRLDVFRRQMAAEQARVQTRNLVTGGSPTANKGAELFDMLAGDAHAASSGRFTNMLDRLTGRGIDAISNAVNKANHAATARELFGPRAGDQADEFLRSMEALKASRDARRSGNAAGLTRLAGAAGAAAGPWRR